MLDCQTVKSLVAFQFCFGNESAKTDLAQLLNLGIYDLCVFFLFTIPRIRSVFHSSARHDKFVRFVQFKTIKSQSFFFQTQYLRKKEDKQFWLIWIFQRLWQIQYGGRRKNKDYLILYNIKVKLQFFLPKFSCRYFYVKVSDLINCY